jgi:MOSC domain-containing protein YiiM
MAVTSDTDLAEALAARIRSLPAPPADDGEIALVVVRPDPGERITPARVKLTPNGGVEGDRWLKRENPLPAAQVTVMRADVARVLCNGHPLSLFGDNLLVHLDLSLANLPAGTRVMVGTALCEVTEKPHTGCVKFSDRFGQAARDLTGAEGFKELRLRGLYVRVIEAGEVGPGDRMRVLARA